MKMVMMMMTIYRDDDEDDDDDDDGAEGKSGGSVDDILNADGSDNRGHDSDDIDVDNLSTTKAT